jgi:hypothetical protein
MNEAPAHTDVPAHTLEAQVRLRRQQLARLVTPRPSEIRAAVKDVEGFNAKVAVLITRGVGTMVCAYVFAGIALISLPDALKAGRPAIISWIAQTFLQLVLLSIIMVGQSVQAATSDARGAKEFADTEMILDRLDEHTAGGITTVLDRIDALEQKLGGRTAT